MKLRISVIVLLIGVWMLGVAFNTQAQSDAGANEWKRYELGKGNFSALFPGQPKEEFKASPPSLEVQMDLHIYSVGTGEGSFVAQYGLMGAAAGKLPETAKQSFYDGVWLGASESFDKRMEENKLSFRTKLVERREIKLSGYDGREIVYTVGALHGRIWITVIGRQAFILMVMGTEKMPVEDQLKFLNSFTITLKPIPVDQPKTIN